MPCHSPRPGTLRRFSVLLPTLMVLLLLSGFVPRGAMAAFAARTLGDFDQVTVVEVSGNFDALDGNGLPNLEPRRALAREFYRLHGDDYDFLVIFTNFAIQMPSPQALGFFSPARNDVRGIGLKLYDQTAAYSPEGTPLARLQGTIDMGHLAGHALEPADPEFDDTLRTLTHEMLHRWGAYVRFLDGGTVSEALLGRDGAHWSFLLDAGGSTLYGNTWRDNGDGTFTSLPPEQGRAGEVIGRLFNPLELYLMGLLDKRQVPPMRLIEAPGIDPRQLPEAGMTIPGTLKSVTIDDVIAVEGERLPAAADARKSFRMAFIHAVLPGSWHEDDPLDRGELAAIARLRTEWEKRFSILTAGAGTVQTTLLAPGEVDSNPATVEPEDLPSPAPNVRDGVAWLLARQLPDGSWRDLAGDVRRDTAVAVGALRLFPTGASAAARGRQWLAQARYDNNDFWARALLAGVDAGAITSARNVDGGWGSAVGFRSNAVDTARALRALTAGSGGPAVVQGAIAWLHAAQNPDGGWSNGSGGSQIQATAEALLALNAHRHAYPLEPAIADGLAWLVARQQGPGGFGQIQATVGDTAIALRALKAAGAPLTVVGRAVDWLLSRQGVDGSWNGSVFQTAGAVEALYAGQVAADLTVTAADITCTPTLIASIPADVTVGVTLRNLGSEPATQVDVSLYDGDPLQGRLLATQFMDVAGQGSATAVFTTTIEAFGLHRLHVVLDGADRLAEANEWNNTAFKTVAVNLPPPVVGFDLPASAGAESLGTVPLAVRLSYPWPEPLTVDYVAVAGTAAPGNDYLPLAGRLTFAADETVQTVSLAILDDCVAESDKTVVVELAQPDRGSLGTARHVYTIRDDEPPTVTIVSPPAGVIGLERPPLIFTTTGGEIVVAVDGARTGKVSGELLDRLNDGEHTLEVIAGNSFGMTTAARVDFTVDTTLPTVVIHSPRPDRVAGPCLLLDYAVTSSVRQELLVDGMALNAISGATLGPLADGWHTLTITAWNAAGAKSSAQVTFRVDARPPRVEILQPANEYSREDHPILLYRSDEDGATSVWLDGVEIALGVGEAFGPLADGIHHLRVAVTDAAGNVGTDDVLFAVSTRGEVPYALDSGWPRAGEGGYGGIAVDPMGNLCMVTRKAEREFSIVKYDPSGKALWQVTRSSNFNIQGGNWVDVEPQDVAIDSGGNIYVVGWGYYVSRYYSVLAKYDAGGSPLGAVVLDTGMLYGNVMVSSVHVDASDRVHIGGNADNALFGPVRSDAATIFVATYDTQLRLLHGRTYGEPGDPASFRFVSRDALTVDADGHLLMVGRSGAGRFLLWKLAPDLARAGLEVAGDNGTSGLGVAIGRSGAIHVAGSGPDGGVLWTFHAEGALANMRKVSPYGLVSLVANLDGSVLTLDNMGTVRKLDAYLDELWAMQLGVDFNAKMVISATGQLFVGGNEAFAGNEGPLPSVVAALSDPRHPRFYFDRPVVQANGPLVALSGYLAPGHDVSLESADCNLVDYHHDAASGRWQMVVAGLPEGTHRLAVGVANAAGFVKRYEIDVVIDTVPPFVAIDSPADGSVWTSRPVLSYRVDAGDIKVFVNGVEVTRRSGFTLDSLRLGENHIRVQVTDPAGNPGFDDVVIRASGDAVGEYPPALEFIGKFGTVGEQTLIDSGLDAAGNIYLLGDTARGFPGSSDSSRDLFVAKFNPSGQRLNLWQLGSSVQEDYGAALVVTAAGGFVVASNVTGYNALTGSDDDFVAVAAYDGNGRQLWRDQLDSGAADRIYDLAVDGAGNIYACGSTRGRLNNKKYGGNEDFFLIKYSPQGGRAWTVLSNLPTQDLLRDIEVSSDGFLYATGRVNDAYAMSLCKFDLNGALLWRKDYARAGHSLVGARLRIGRDGSLFTLVDSGCPDHYLLTKHDRDGAFLQDFLGQAPAVTALELVLDAAGNLYVTGFVDDDQGLGWLLDGNHGFGDEDLFVARHDAGLKRLWSRQFGDSSGQQGRELLFSPNTGQMFLAGITEGDLGGPGSGEEDVFLARLTGLAEWSVPELVIAGYRSPTNRPVQAIRGRVSPGAVVTASLAAPAGAPPVSVPVTHGVDGGWQVLAAGLASNADNVLTLHAVGPIGAVSQVVTITVDTLPPLLTIAPVDSPTELLFQTIRGQVEPDAVLTVADSTSPIIVAEGVWSYLAGPFHDDTNSYSFLATDAAGNATTCSVSIVRLPPPPPLLTVTPAMIARNEAADVLLALDNAGPPGTTVMITQVLDLDGNGLADADEPVVRRFFVTDGVAPDNPNLPADGDGSANGSIVTVLDYRFVNDRYHAPGRYLFTAATPAGDAVAGLNVAAIAASQSLGGTVRDEQGQAVGGILVELRDSWGHGFGFALSDVEGGYRFDLENPGDYWPLPMAEGYLADLSAVTPVTIAVGRTVTRDLVLARGARQVSGRVVDAAALTGLAGVLVRAENSRYAAATMTATDGSYRLTLRDGEYGLSVESRPGDGLASHGYPGTQMPLRAVTVAGDLPGCDLPVVSTSLLVCGRVATAAGAPVGGVPVQAVAIDESEWLAEAYTDMRGTFCLPLAAADGWRLQLREADAYGIGLVGTWGESINRTLTVYPVDAWVTGHVRDVSGRPLAGIALTIAHDNGTVTTVRTDIDGRYLLGISAEPAGVWRLDVAAAEAGFAPFSPVTLNAVRGMTESRELTLFPLMTNTIAVTRAAYDARKKILTVEATSQHANAQLQVDGHGPMVFSRLFKGVYYWTFSRDLPVKPATVTVSGPEGVKTATVQ